MIEVAIINILRIAIISTIGISLILVLKKTLFKEYTKNFNYYIWLIVIFRMILPLKVPVYITTGAIDSNKNGINNIEKINNHINGIDTVTNSIDSNQAIEGAKQFTNNLNVLEILGCVWLTVSLVIIVYRIYTYIKFKNTIVDLSWDPQDSKLEKIYRNLLVEMKIKKQIQLKISDYLSIPAGIGFFKAYIILPNTNYEEKEAEWILRHELMHYKKNDILYKFLVMIITSIYWFNPLIYVMNKYINTECELACDEKVLKNCNFKERQNYALTLINSLKHKERSFLKNNLVTGFGDKKILERRFDSMFNKKNKKGVFIGIISIIIAVCSLGVISTKSSANTNVIEEEVQASTENKENPIELYEITNSKYKGYYLEIKDPTRVKIACTSKLGKEGETVSKIAKNNNAIAAINGGGFYGPAKGVKKSGDGATPIGIVMTDGKVVYTDADKNEKIDLFAITKDGQMIVGKYSEKDLLKLGVQEALSFGPSLIVNGKKVEFEGDGGWGIAPRTVIGQKKDGTIIMLVVNGRGIESIGATITEVQEIMYKLGAINALNLDGGKSTEMYYNGDIINKPAGSIEEREMPTAIIVK